MTESEMPAHVAEVLQRLRTKKPAQAAILDRLEDKWRKAEGDERERVERLIVQLGKPDLFGRGLVAVAVLGALVVGYVQLEEARLREQVRTGARAVARVERLEEGFCWFGGRDSECVQLTLNVRPTGAAAFTATVTRDLSHVWLPRVQPGSLVVVAIPRDSPRTALLNEEALKEPPPAP